jgi:hypothetical protein
MAKPTKICRLTCLAQRTVPHFTSGLLQGRVFCIYTEPRTLDSDTT